MHRPEPSLSGTGSRLRATSPSVPSRLRHWRDAARTLYRGGSTLPGILLWPVRRRLHFARNQVELRGGITLLSPPEEPLLHVFREVWIERCYLPTGFDLLPRCTVVDVGAHVGVFTLWAATREPGARIVAVEPGPRALEFLRRNLASNGVCNVRIVEGACAGTSGDAVLYDRGLDVSHSIYDRGRDGTRFPELTRTRTMTLGELYHRESIEQCHLLKLDCEGAEYEILLGADRETLSRTHQIVMECHLDSPDHAPSDLAAHLRCQGFEVRATPEVDTAGGYLYARRRR